MLDGNAAAGLLFEIFSAEMTMSTSQCAHCGHSGEVGSLLAFTHAPGLVLCCPVCENPVLRIVQAPEAIYLDARGAVYLKLPRSGSS